MICIRSQYFSLNRILFLAIGLWPYQQSKLTRLQIILLFGIIMSIVLFQFASFMTIELSFNAAIKILTPSFLFIIYLSIYISLWINVKTIKYSLEQLQYICNELKDKNEIAIIETHGYDARCFTIKIILLVLSINCLLTGYLFFPNTFHNLLFTNKSHSQSKVPIMLKYFVDQEKYVYLILLHIIIALWTGTVIVTAMGTMIVGFFKYACGMFKIASYRIRKAISIAMLNIQYSENETEIYKNLIYAVDIHHKAMWFVAYLNTNFEIICIFLTIVLVIALSLNLYQISLLIFNNNKEEFLYSLINVGVLLTCMFSAGHFGQDIIDHNNYLFFTVYDVPWYTAPLYVQKFILFLLQIRHIHFSLNICNLLEISMENFATLLNASISYFVFIQSIE